MKKMKVDDLIGNGLDWAVAMAKGRAGQAQLILNRPMSHNYRPSTDGAIGNTIMESEDFVDFVKWENNCGTPEHTIGWDALIGTEPDTIYGRGPTILIAAMRCFVKSKFGDVIQIPKELA